MSGRPLTMEPLSGTTFGVIADAHVHPESVPELPTSIATAFRGVDGIIALGDMGDATALDGLQRLAPLIAVRGMDDPAGDSRVTAERRLLGHEGRVIGAVFDGSRQGLFVSNDPFQVAPEFAEAALRLFGQPVSLLLCAGSHKPVLAWRDGILIVNPGSPTLADQRTVALLHLNADHVSVRHVAV